MVVFDAVFHKVEDDLVQIILQNQNGAVVVQLQIKGDSGLKGVVFQHSCHPPHGGGHEDDFHVLLPGHVFRPGQGKQLFCHTVQPFRLIADVADKFPGGFQIHVVLQNGVRQQLNGSQRRFQLMGRVGDKAASLLLGGLQTLRQFVKFVAQNGQLIVAAHVDLVGVVALPDDPHGSHDSV